MTKYPNRYLVEKPVDETEWLAARWKNVKGEARITASVAGVVHGQHQFKSVADLAIELAKETAPIPDGGNEDTERGNMMEPFVRGVAEVQHGIELTVPTSMFAYEEPGVRLMATVDAMTVEPLPRVFELKTWRGYWKGTLPSGWYWQGVHIAICCDVPQVEWAILDAQTQVHHHIQVVTSDEKQIHVDACRKFLGYIDTGMTPDNAVFTYDHIKSRYPESTEKKTVELPEETITILQEIAAAKTQAKVSEQVASEGIAKIVALMEDAEFAEIGGHVVATWKTSHPMKFDQKAFAVAHPALFESFKKPGVQRTFLSKIKGDDE